MTLPYKRILLKISGEALMGDKNYGHDPAVMQRISQEILDIYNKGIEICLVVGGGNIFRGVTGAAMGMERTTADYIGMLATIMNALAMQNSLEKQGVQTRVLSAIPVSTICEPYIRRRATRHMEKGRIVIFAAGIGSPFFTTDTVAALRAVEMRCDLLLKGTQVDGVYSDNPNTNQDAVRYEEVTYKKVLKDELKIMDAAAISLAKENDMPIMVFSIQKPGELARVLQHQGEYTLIKVD